MPFRYEEIIDSTADVIDTFGADTGGKVVGHFTQLVWANTSHIGCALSKDTGYTYLACNYGDGGNIIELPVYKRGTPCSECESGTKCHPIYSGLCGAAKLKPTLLLIVLVLI
ncbi:hypothetical protein NQ314_017850, partial [Rhamnusium bicolor]